MTSSGDPEILEFIVRNSVHHSRDDQWWVAENEARKAFRPDMRAELESTGGLVVGPSGLRPIFLRGDGCHQHPRPVWSGRADPLLFLLAQP